MEFCESDAVQLSALPRPQVAIAYRAVDDLARWTSKVSSLGAKSAFQDLACTICTTLCWSSSVIPGKIGRVIVVSSAIDAFRNCSAFQPYFLV